MNILFVSYEYPGLSPFGGIGTYLKHIALSLADKNVQVYVICANTGNDFKEINNNNLSIYSIPCAKREDFPAKALEVYENYFVNKIKIDVIESPEFGADAIEIKKSNPAIPLIVKFHTPSFLVKRLNNFYKQKFKERLKRFFKIKQYNKFKDPEYQITTLADALITPSISLGDIISREWDIKREKIQTIPYPFYMTDSFAQIQQKPADKNSLVITFIGRLEARKGIINLTEAIRLVLNERNDIVFRFIGRPVKLANGLMADQYIKKILNHNKNVEFKGTVPLEDIPGWLESTDVCIFPSIWENFPNVCLEAMAAGKGIIASKEGGMKDMIEDVAGGILISPHSPQEIKNAIIRFAENRSLCLEMGSKAKNKMNHYYSKTVIDELINHYNSIIKLKKI